MKRRVFILVAALVVLSAFVVVAAPKFRIAVSLPPANNAWQAKMLDSVNAEVAKDTTNFDITVKNAVDDADQLNQMTTFKAGEYDMILCLPGNGTLMTPICQEIYKSGTKLLIIDRAIEGDQYTDLLRRRQRGLRQERGEVHRRPAEGQGPDRDPAQLRGNPHRPAALQRVHGSAEEELPRDQGPC